MAYNYIRYRETPCTTKDGFGLADSDEAEPDVAGTTDGANRRRTITTNDDDNKVQVLRMTSVVLDGNHEATVDDATLSTTDKDAAVSSTSGSESSDVESRKDDVSSVTEGETLSAVVIDLQEKMTTSIDAEPMATDADSTDSRSPLGEVWAS
jgi:hypothetical protein